MLFEEIMIFGCGNPLFADDGFGPEVVEELKKYTLPDNVKVVDAGLGGPHFLFTLLAQSDEPVKQIIIVDIADFGGEPGQLARLSVSDLPPGRYRDAHSWDLTEPLHLLRDKIDIIIIGCQPKRVTEPDFEIGLSDEVQAAIPKTIRTILDIIGVHNGTEGTAFKDLRDEGEDRIPCRI